MNYRLVSFQIILLMIFSFMGVSAQNQITTNFNLFDPITGKPLIFLPGTNTVQQNVTLPSTLPTVGQTWSNCSFRQRHHYNGVGERGWNDS
ncbi:MAG: hypothetical protein IPM83_12290 [Ignavibacteria bacterium]|nr:hypothetical protein [Ignavibacteria bacterium]